MIDRLVTLALEKRLVVAMICIIIAIYGAYCWTQLPVEAYPDVADTASQVVTQAPGLAAEEVEQQVTIPLERELNGTPGLAMMRSRSTLKDGEPATSNAPTACLVRSANAASNSSPVLASATTMASLAPRAASRIS